MVITGKKGNEAKKSIGLEVRFAKKGTSHAANEMNGSFLLIASNGYYTLRSVETNKQKKRAQLCLK